MAAFVNLSRVVLIGSTWTGTAPGGASAPSGTITTSTDISGFVMSGEFSGAAAMVEGTTFGSAGYEVKYPGLKSGDDITFEAVSDYAASQLYSVINPLFVASTLVYLDLKPVTGSRAATNPSTVCAGYISKWTPYSGGVGDLAKSPFTITITGRFGDLTS